MHRIIVGILFLIALPVVLAAGTMFSDQIIIQEITTKYPESVYASDLDGDGDIDVLSASSGDNKIAWYENYGRGNFSEQRIISTLGRSMNDVYAADLDGDGDNDVLSASYSDGKISWYAYDGNGNFSGQRIITISAQGANEIHAADLDGDGDIDVISASWLDGKIAWYENDGCGNFSDQIEIADRENAVCVYSADINGDGANDVIAAFWGFQVVWYENDGNGNFGSENLLLPGNNSARCVYAADLDSDGDKDVVVALSEHNDTIVWFENNGYGEFSEPKVITQIVNGPFSVFAADVDNDGDTDVLSASISDGKIAWYENTGDGEFGAQRVITSRARGAICVHADDLDGDGDFDVLSASKSGHRIAWYRNEGGNFEDKNDITTAANGARSVYAADLDGDGDKDVLCAAPLDDMIVWYRNNGGGEFSNQKVITTSADNHIHVYVADLDGDGDEDIFSASCKNDIISWYENDGFGIFGDQNIITTSVDCVTCLDAGDLDGDGDLDIVSSSYSDSKIAWYKNLGSGSFSDQIGITAGARWARNSLIIDVDGDEDNDIVYSGAFGGWKIAWFENDGEGYFFNSKDLHVSDYQPIHIHATDLDSDGDMDLLAAFYPGGTISWFENLNYGQFGDQKIISTNLIEPKDIIAADLDNDGDMDVLYYSAHPRILAWHENDGSEVFSDGKLISGSLRDINSIHAADIDGDGDIDVLSALHGNEQKILWFKNLLFDSGTEMPGTMFTGFQNLKTDPFIIDTASSMGCAWGDYDGDGWEDLFVANDGGEDNYLYRNNGDGSFTKITDGPVVMDGGPSFGGSWGDYDNDGHLDLFVANAFGEANFLYRNLGDGTFEKIVDGEIVTDAFNTWGCSWSDVDCDGELDLFTANVGENNRLYLNDGDGTFTPVTEGSVVTDGGSSVSGMFSDYDGDGYPDLFVSNKEGEANFLYHNERDGSFTRITDGDLVTETGETWSASWEDFDADGYPDLFVGNNGDANRLYLNGGNGAFDFVTTGDIGSGSEHTRSSGWGDYNNDGDMDVYASNRDEDSHVCINTEYGTFTKFLTESVNGRGCAWADFDHDGDVDLFVCVDGGPNLLYENTTDNDRGWVQVVCEGTQSNRSAIGAKVRVKAEIEGVDVWQVKELSGQTGFGGQNSLVAEFGFKDAARVDTIRVEWPSGEVTDTTDVALNQRLVLREPDEVAGIHDAVRPTEFALLQNYPNPFNPETTIAYVLPVRTEVTLSIFTIQGKRVIDLVSGVQEAGAYTVRWTGRDDAGQHLASGMYLYRLSTPTFTRTRKLMLMR